MERPNGHAADDHQPSHRNRGEQQKPLGDAEFDFGEAPHAGGKPFYRLNFRFP
jgi:hypothetical protein